MRNAARSLRIVHVITRLINGGADENTVLSCNHAARAGHKVVLVHGAVTEPEILAMVDDRVRVIAVPALVRSIKPVSDVRALRDLVEAFGRLRPDIVHTHTSKAGVLGRLAARLAGVPVIVHGVHSTVPFMGFGRVEAFVYLTAERVVQRMTHAFIDVGSAVRDLCLNAGIGTRERHHVIHSGFDLASFRAATPPEHWQELLRLEPGQPRPPVLLMIAALAPHKRHAEFLNSFRRIVVQIPDIRLVLAGAGPLRESICAQIDALGLRDNVVLTGFHPHPEQLIALADVCVLASSREGLPRVVVQYLAGGRPVVTTDLPGLGDVLRRNVNAIIVPADNVDGLAEGVLTLLEDDSRRARLARGAAATDLSEWDSERMGDRIAAVYGSIYAERRTTLAPTEAV